MRAFSLDLMFAIVSGFQSIRFETHVRADAPSRLTCAYFMGES